MWVCGCVGGWGWGWGWGWGCKRHLTVARPYQRIFSGARVGTDSAVLFKAHLVPIGFLSRQGLSQRALNLTTSQFDRADPLVNSRARARCHSHSGFTRCPSLEHYCDGIPIPKQNWSTCQLPALLPPRRSGRSSEAGSALVPCFPGLIYNITTLLAAGARAC